MKITYYPKRESWGELTQRPAGALGTLTKSVHRIIDAVRDEGDSALLAFTHEFDRVRLSNLAVADEVIAKARNSVSEDLRRAISSASENIKKFHAAQRVSEISVETSPGVECSRRVVPIDRVGLYIPGGSAVLFSTALMLGVPARLAGCSKIIACTPPDKNGSIPDVLAYTLESIGITKIYCVGGAQAIAAMAYGTATVPKVDKIFGPGNSYVTCAKQLLAVAGQVAIDLPAGPTEQLLIADESMPPEFAAADLLSQAEHGPDSQVILLATSEGVLQKIVDEVERQLTSLPRHEIASRALDSSRAILFASIEEALEFSNFYAPEHLLLCVKQAEDFQRLVRNAGSVFIGPHSPEAVGDYASGTNHTLPTGGLAHAMGGVSLESFMKAITFQKLTAQGLLQLGPIVESLAYAEGLAGHARAVSIRTESLKKKGNL